MFYFSWKKMFNETSSVKSLLLIYEMLVMNKVPNNKFDPLYRYYGKDFSGQDFLINPYDLLEIRHRYKDKELVEYIALAARRPLADYLATGVRTLPLIHSPISQQRLNTNRLLRIEGDQIVFIYEEVLF